MFFFQAASLITVLFSFISDLQLGGCATPKGFSEFPKEDFKFSVMLNFSVPVHSTLATILTCQLVLPTQPQRKSNLLCIERIFVFSWLFLYHCTIAPSLYSCIIVVQLSIYGLRINVKRVLLENR